ncbi:MAG: hypothetical protein WA057_06085 [Candidatus Magasanikiibacteriota bacterium]
MRKKQHFKFIFLVSVLLVFFGVGLAGFVETADTPSLKINNSAGTTTKTRKVTLYIKGTEDAKYMKVSNDVGFAEAEWEVYSSRKSWFVSFGAGTKTVYIRFKNVKGDVSNIYSGKIQLSAPKAMDVDFFINAEIDKSNKDKKISAKDTDSRYVNLDLTYSTGVEGYIASNDSNNFTDLEFKPIVDRVAWVLSPGAGEKTIYVQFLNSNGQKETVSKKIIYNQPSVYLEEGTLMKGQGSTIYYYGYDGRLHPFLNSGVYHSWYKDFNNIRFLSNAKLSEYQIGPQVCVRPGTWLLKFKGLPKIYAVEPGCQLRPILSEAEAYLLYGSEWVKRVLELDSVHASNYNTLTYNITDVDLEIVDSDRDGVSKETEDKYGSSDKKLDTDGDGLADLEEINFWFSDPTNKDTDDDGYTDMKEILNGYPAAGYGNLNTLLADTYEYSIGSIVKKYSDKKLYYRHSNGKYYYVGRDVTDKNFKNYKFDSKFIIQSPYKIDFTVEKKSFSNTEIIYPTEMLAGDIIKM